jgi:hypothetical protein
MRYRLLDTTRAYALDIKLDDAELADLAARHAVFYQRWLEQTGPEWLTPSTAAERAPHLARGPPHGARRSRVGLAWRPAPVLLRWPIDWRRGAVLSTSRGTVPPGVGASSGEGRAGTVQADSLEATYLFNRGF